MLSWKIPIISFATRIINSLPLRSFRVIRKFRFPLASNAAICIVLKIINFLLISLRFWYFNEERPSINLLLFVINHVPGSCSLAPLFDWWSSLRTSYFLIIAYNGVGIYESMVDVMFQCHLRHPIDNWYLVARVTTFNLNYLIGIEEFIRVLANITNANIVHPCIFSERSET